jgi:hypothetical protein
MHIVNIPSILYGTEIKPGSFTLTTNLNHEYYDDVYGGVYSGSVLKGCMFYQHGIVYFGHDFDAAGLVNVTASFSGTNKIPLNIYLCRVPRGALNFTNNPSYTSYLSSANGNVISTKSPKTFITGIGLMDENYKLLGIAKVSSPVLNEESTGIVFKLKLNF